jgi:hypothetical protein
MRGSGENSAIRCLYLDQLSNVKRYCGIEHGPDCRNLSPLEENYVTNTESIEFEGIDLSYLGNSTKLCISVVAGTGNKRVRIEGMYDISKQNDIEMPLDGVSTTARGSAFIIQMSLTYYVGSIGITILMMCVF